LRPRRLGPARRERRLPVWTALLGFQPGVARRLPPPPRRSAPRPAGLTSRETKPAPPWSSGAGRGAEATGFEPAISGVTDRYVNLATPRLQQARLILAKRLVGCQRPGAAARPRARAAAANTSSRAMVCARSGPIDNICTGTPTSAS